MNLRIKRYGQSAVNVLTTLSCILTPVRTQQLMYEFTVDSLWTWVDGSTSPDPTCIWGTRGIPSPPNAPAGRYAHQIVIDSSDGSLYMFGGMGKVNNTQTSNEYHYTHLRCINFCCSRTFQ